MTPLDFAKAFDRYACRAWDDENCLLVTSRAAEALLDAYPEATASPCSTYTRVKLRPSS